MMKKLYFFALFLIAQFGFSQEMLTNPGFESGFAAPWAKGTGSGYTEPTLVTAAPHSGTNNVKYAAPSATTGFYQNVSVVAGSTYIISFWYKASGDDTDARLWSIYKDAANAAVYTTEAPNTDQFRTNNGYLATTISWKKHTATMPAGTGAVSLDVAVRAYSASTNVEFDDFSLMNQASASVDDIDFDSKVVMNTIVNDFLVLGLPSRSTVNIYSMEGKLISSDRVNDGGKISTTNLANGIYFVTVENNTSKTSRKIIKM
jgi:hypothetical protein